MNQNCVTEMEKKAEKVSETKLQTRNGIEVCGEIFKFLNNC